MPVDLSAFPGKIHMQNIDPPVLTVDGFLSGEQCDALVEAASSSNLMRQSAVGGVSQNVDIRTSSTLAITSQVLQDCPSLKQALDALLHNATLLLQLGPDGLSLQSAPFKLPQRPGQICCELPQVARYTQGAPPPPAIGGSWPLQPSCQLQPQLAGGSRRAGRARPPP
jgi:hypothetical protein